MLIEPPATMIIPSMTGCLQDYCPVSPDHGSSGSLGSGVVTVNEVGGAPRFGLSMNGRHKPDTRFVRRITFLLNFYDLPWWRRRDSAPPQRHQVQPPCPQRGGKGLWQP